MANYWKEKREQELAQGWLVVSSDMDGVTGYKVVHALDVNDVRRGSYWGGAVKHITLNSKEANEFASQLNQNNVEPPENLFRGAFR